MIEIIQLLIGIIALASGFPIGNFLAKQTQEELKSGQKWFKLIMIAGVIGGTIALFFKNDAIMFGLFFIAIVTSRSILR